MEIFTVSIKENGALGVELNGELEEVINLEEFENLGELIKSGLVPIVEAISLIVSKNLEGKINE